MTDDRNKKVRLRATIVDGVLELESGGVIPIADRASLEILVAAKDISDPLLVRLMSEKNRILILPEGTRLVAAISSRVGHGDSVLFHDGELRYDDIARKVQKQLNEDWYQDAPALVGLTIGPKAIKRGQMEFYEQGGLWLKTRGLRAEGLEVSSVLLPKSFGDEEVRSLNHALTRISETLETWRISHTYNVYERIFYQETNGYWYPLQWLRDEQLHNEEHQIAYSMWQRYNSQVTVRK